MINLLRCRKLRSGESVRGKKKYKVLKDGRSATSVTPGKYAGWKPKKIFGRLDCRSGMKMKPENRVFFKTWDDAIRAGYRPCKKCNPTP
jgi:hypothetical protein